jgi:hypothetical protein
VRVVVIRRHILDLRSDPGLQNTGESGLTLIAGLRARASAEPGVVVVVDEDVTV